MLDLRRRDVLGLAAVSALTAGALSSCAAAPVVEAAFNPAVDTWLADLAVAIGAQLIANGAQKAIDGASREATALWESWHPKVEKQLETQPLPVGDSYYGHPMPPVVFTRLAERGAKHFNAMSDHLAAFVNGGKDVVIFEAWAWQGISLFVNALTSGKVGDELAAYKALCAYTLAPSGQAPKTGASPEGAVSYMTYQARAGSVEVARFNDTVQIRADGIPTKANQATVRKFRLPSTAA